MVRFGYSIRTLRQARGMTAAELAHKAEISAAYVSLIEGEQRRPPESILIKLAEALKVSLAFLQSLIDGTRHTTRSARVQQLREALKRLEEAEKELKRRLN